MKCPHETLKRRYDNAYYCGDCTITIISKQQGTKAIHNELQRRQKAGLSDNRGIVWEVVS